MLLPSTVSDMCIQWIVWCGSSLNKQRSYLLSNMLNTAMYINIRGRTRQRREPQSGSDVTAVRCQVGGGRRLYCWGVECKYNGGMGGVKPQLL